MSETPKLLPCPFCGSEAEFGRDTDTGSINFDGCFIQCSNARCEASSAIIFPLKEPVEQLLAERWNRRPVPDSVKALVEAGKGILLHACIADADPRDVDEEDKALERALRAAIEAVEKEIGE